MSIFSYRAVSVQGSTSSGEIEADTRELALAALRRKGLSPLDLKLITRSAKSVRVRLDSKSRSAVTKTIGELAVLITAGLQLDRALGLAIENIEHAGVRSAFVNILALVKEGKPLSRAMAENSALFAPMAIAMTEAGEADGKLGDALERLSNTLTQADDLRTLIGTSMIYPVILTGIAVGVILMMLLFVVPQFESLFASSGDRLPAASRMVMRASQLLRAHGVILFILLLIGIFLLRQWLRMPGLQVARDRFLLGLPQIGMLIRYADTARFSRTLGVLITGGVPLPNALAMAQRAISNRVIGDAVAKISSGVKEGEGLTAPLAAAGIFPKLALGFFRTGEETSQLGPMLEKLADVLDRDIKVRLQRLIGLLTPAITVILGIGVATIIAAIMAAILGFNDLAVT
jgi:general secretion pathway protein F